MSSGHRMRVSTKKEASRDRCESTEPTRAARALALAYAIEQALEDGRYRSASEAAAAFGVTRARMSQVLSLRQLPVAVQVRVLMGDEERSLRGLIVDAHGYDS